MRKHLIFKNNLLLILFVFLIIAFTLEHTYVWSENMHNNYFSIKEIDWLAYTNKEYISYDECFYSEVCMKQLLKITPDFASSYYENELFIRHMAKKLEDRFDESSNMIYLHALAKLLVDYSFHEDYDMTKHPSLNINYELIIKITLINLCKIKFSI